MRQKKYTSQVGVFLKEVYVIFYFLYVMCKFASIE